MLSQDVLKTLLENELVIAFIHRIQQLKTNITKNKVYISKGINTERRYIIFTNPDSIFIKAQTT